MRRRAKGRAGPIVFLSHGSRWDSGDGEGEAGSGYRYCGGSRRREVTRGGSVEPGVDGVHDERGRLEPTSSQESDGDDRVALAQSLLQRCLQKDTLLIKLYMQLIKQTTDHPEPSSRVSARHWSLLCAAVGAALPPVKPIRRLLLAHLRYRGTALHTGEEGKFARRAEQVALSTAQVPRRLAAPSKEELLCAAARRPMHVRVLLLDGKQHGLVFGPAATADHLVTMLREKIGLNDASGGYALYEVCANSTPAGAGERALNGNERVGDVLARWEKAGATAAACRLVFKKRLFLGERPLQSACVAEMQLLYYQILHAVRHDRLPIETDEAIEMQLLYYQILHAVRHDRLPIETDEAIEMQLLYYQILHAVRHDRLPIETDEAIEMQLLYYQILHAVRHDRLPIETDEAIEMQLLYYQILHAVRHDRLPIETDEAIEMQLLYYQILHAVRHDRLPIETDEAIEMQLLYYQILHAVRHDRLPIETDEAIEMQLLYYQILHAVRHDRLPIETDEAIEMQLLYYQILHAVRHDRLPIETDEAIEMQLLYYQILHAVRHDRLPIETDEAIEMQLLYYQILHAVRHDRLPIETDEAVMLAALHAQVVNGDCLGGGEECAHAAGAVLPARLAHPALPAPAVRLHHLALRGTAPLTAMQRALTLAGSWPLARATIFDVTQSFTSNWPRALWLAVDARGLTLLRRGSRAALVSHDHDQLLAVSPAPRALLLVTRQERKHAKLVLSTDQGAAAGDQAGAQARQARAVHRPADCTGAGVQLDQLLAVSPAPRALLLVTRQERKHAKLVLSTDQLLAVSPAPRALLLVTRQERKHAKLVLSTDQAYQIATLIKDYIEAVRGPVSPAVAAPADPAGARGAAAGQAAAT
ncbi:myTH4 domain-containing protein [Phthorimaea operculella]|nr:myTH4 domain-containing protein [Phthorimaea operculella]